MKRNAQPHEKGKDQKKYHVYNLLFQIVYKHQGNGAMRNMPSILFLPQQRINIAAIQAGERQVLDMLTGQAGNQDLQIIDVAFLYASHLGFMTEAEFEEGATNPGQPQQVTEEQLLDGLAEVGITPTDGELPELPNNPFKM